MLLFVDGFDAYGATSDLTKKWGLAGPAGVTWASNIGRWGGAGLQLASTSGSYLMTLPLRPTLNGYVLAAFWGKFGTTKPSAAATFMMMTNSAGIANSVNILYLTTSGTLAAQASYTANGQFAAAGTINVCDGQWHWIEWFCSTQTTTVAATIYVDGVRDVNSTGGINAALPSYDRFAIGFSLSTGVTTQIDDLIIWDNQTGLQTGELTQASFPIGAKRIETMWPSGAGANTNWSPLTGSNYAEVNENPSDWDTSYVQASSSGIRDSYAFPGSIVGVNPLATVVNCVAKNADAGSINFQGLTYSGSTFGLGDSKIAGSAYATTQFPIFRDPNTAAAWTKAGVNAAQFGVGVV